MTKEHRIAAFSKLGNWMQNLDPQTMEFIRTLQSRNAWYTSENVNKQFISLGESLEKETLEEWLTPYTANDVDKSVGLILAGNLPLVGFHDILSTLIMGFTAVIKVSSDDAGLTTHVLHKLIEIEPLFEQKIKLVDKLQHFDLVIATGSNNSARYFEYYFGKKPHIIRKNRNSVAVLTGNESAEELAELGKDIFDYFGLGCRSVSKIFIPKGYKLEFFFEAVEYYNPIKDHHKYHNNYEYNKSIYLINKNKHFDNGFLLLKEDAALASPLAVVHYEEYEDLTSLTAILNQQKESIQCLVCNTGLDVQIPAFLLGRSQHPKLNDYADGEDTLAFLDSNR